MTTDPRSLFLDAIRATGLTPPEYIEPGKWYRFPGIGKGSKNTAASCLLFSDSQGGFFRDWSSDFSQLWFVHSSRKLSKAERMKLATRARVEQARYHEEQRLRQASAAGRAKSIWATAAFDVGSHPYPARKGIQPHGARLYRGALVLPVINFDGVLTSLQFINEDGRKVLLKGGRKQGCFIPVSTWSEA